MYDCLSCCFFVIFFFFKQKTAYEMLRSLVGSEMCIRDRVNSIKKDKKFIANHLKLYPESLSSIVGSLLYNLAVSYTHLTLPTIYSV